MSENILSVRKKVVILQLQTEWRIRLAGPGREILILKIKGSNPLCATKERLALFMILWGGKLPEWSIGLDSKSSERLAVP